MTQSTLHFFTIVARNYLAYAIALGDSVKQYHPNSVFSIYLVDDTQKEHVQKLRERGFEVLYPDQVAIPSYQSLVFQYTVVEACTAVKPFVAKHLLSTGATEVIYLDPDMLCFRPLADVLDALNSYSIVITPSNLHPIDETIYPNDQHSLMHGAYNLGFVAMRNDEITEAFVNWWCHRLSKQCLVSTETGLFVDQKWIDLVPAYFGNVCILRSYAYNIAFWNLAEREITKAGDEWHVLPSNETIALVHFSGVRAHEASTPQKNVFTPLSPLAHTKVISYHDHPGYSALVKLYVALVQNAGHDRYKDIPYAYNSYENSEPVTNLERAIYLTSSFWQDKRANPFASTPDSFQQACRRAGIRKGKKQINTEQIVGDNASPKGYIRIVFSVIRLGLRILLFVLGPDLYFLVAKYIRRQLLPINQGFILRDSH